MLHEVTETLRLSDMHPEPYVDAKKNIMEFIHKEGFAFVQIRVPACRYNIGMTYGRAYVKFHSTEDATRFKSAMRVYNSAVLHMEYDTSKPQVATTPFDNARLLTRPIVSPQLSRTSSATEDLDTNAPIPRGGNRHLARPQPAPTHSPPTLPPASMDDAEDEEVAPEFSISVKTPLLGLDFVPPTRTHHTPVPSRLESASSNSWSSIVHTVGRVAPSTSSQRFGPKQEKTLCMNCFETGHIVADGDGKILCPKLAREVSNTTCKFCLRVGHQLCHYCPVRKGSTILDHRLQPRYVTCPTLASIQCRYCNYYGHMADACPYRTDLNDYYAPNLNPTFERDAPCIM